MSRLDEAVADLLEEKTGRYSPVAAAVSIGGGCINAAACVELRNGRRYFVKSNPAPLPAMFEREAEALGAIAAVGAIRVPNPVGHGGGVDGVSPFLVMEYIEPGTPSPGFQAELGRRFAEHHLRSRHDRYGFEHDNYLGSTPQPNGWSDDWVGFWRERRLGHQLRLARDSGRADAAVAKLGERLMERLSGLIAEPQEPACLLHGDLWVGNFMCSRDGEPVLIDPAAYYGRREADLAMTMLFGGFSRAFYAAYEEAWPLADGSSERLDIYRLYHLLNHLNLFGAGYRGGCLEIMKRYAA